MVRRTSIECYHKIEAEGLLSKVRLDVYKIIFQRGPITIREACMVMSGLTRWNSLSPRFSELERMGVIESVGEKSCQYTGKKVTLWDVTDKLPKPLPKEKKQLCLMCGGKGHL